MILKSAIVAYNKKLAIGKEGRLLWQDDVNLERFKALTIDHAIIMGRKTHESIGKVLPHRHNIIISRDRDFIPLGIPAFVAQNLERAFGVATLHCMDRKQDEVFIIGGGEIYKQALPLCDRLYVSEFDNELEGDTCFPTIDPSEWAEITVEKTDTHTFKMFTRIKPNQ